MTRDRWLMLAGTATALVLGVAAIGWARGGVAPTVSQWPDSAPPPSAGLLRRLAESADAFRSGRVVYLVAQDSGYYNVAGGFYSRDSALALVRANGPTWHAYPTQTSPDPYGADGSVQVILPGCYKDTRTTRWICPTRDSSGALLPVMRLRDVLRIEVTFVQGGGKRTTVRMEPQNAGATIYTLQDFDRFIVPYYTRVLGPAYAARQREELMSFVRRSFSDSARAPH